MKKYLQLFAFVLLLSVATVSCGTDDADTYTEIPNPEPTSPVVMDLNAVPYPKLSDYNFFQGDIKNLEPVYRVIPYDLNSGLFTDYAQKKRFIWMPDNVKATYNEDGKILDFPVGTVLIKNFYYENSLPANTVKIIETRLMIKKQDGWLFANYVWNNEQTEAIQSTEAKLTRVQWDQNGSTMMVNYKIPSIIDCASCHTLNGIQTPIGTKPQNLNKLYTYTDGSKNQLQKLIEVGYLNNNLPSQILSTVDWTNKNLPLETRVRSYLDINCAHCHTPGGPCDYTPMDFAFNRTTNPINLGICVEPSDFASGGEDYLIAGQQIEESLVRSRMNNNISFEMMPPLGRTIVNEEAVELIEEWINSLEPCP